MKKFLSKLKKSKKDDIHNNNNNNLPKSSRLKMNNNNNNNSMKKKSHKHTIPTPKALKESVTPLIGGGRSPNINEMDDHKTEQEIAKEELKFEDDYSEEDIEYEDESDDNYNDIDSNKLIGGRYEDLDCIMGSGSYGLVELVLSHYNNDYGVIKGSQYALKTIMRGFKSMTDSLRLLRELRILRCLSESELIIDLVDIIEPNESPSYFTDISLVFDFMEFDLSKIIKSPQYFTSLHCEFIFYQIIQGIHYFHSANIVHRDLKPANILINRHGQIKICDFGLARSVINEEMNQFLDQNKSNNKSNESNNNTILKRKKRKLSKNKREMTKHVVTRWYRAPEVILLQQKRDNIFGIDIWSAACIFGELLEMMKGMCKSYQRKPLFPGTSCFPFSPRYQRNRNSFENTENTESSWDDHDQLLLIFKQLGCPTNDEINKFKNDENAIKYLKEIRFAMIEYKIKRAIANGLDPNNPKVDTNPCKPAHSFKRRFPAFREVEHNKGYQALDLLSKMLQFDVDRRVSTKDILSHPYFDRVRDKESEIIMDTAPKLEFEDKKLTHTQLRTLICKEIAYYNKKWQQKHFPNLVFKNKNTNKIEFENEIEFENQIEIENDDMDDIQNNNNNNMNHAY